MRNILESVNPTFNNTYIALKSLVQSSYYSQLNSPEHIVKKGLGYFKEYCTVKMCMARRSGHSTAICKVATDYFERALLLSPNEQISENLKSRFLDLNFGGILKAKQYSIETKNGIYTFSGCGNLNKFRGVECEAVFVDVASMLKQSKIDEVYDVLAPCMAYYPQKFFIFVG